MVGSNNTAFAPLANTPAIPRPEGSVLDLYEGASTEVGDDHI